MAVPILNDSLGGEPDAPPLSFRSFDDPDKMRTAVYDNVLNAITKRYPLSNTRYRMELTDLKFEDEKPFSLEEQKRAILKGQTLSRKLSGSWKLFDQVTGQLQDKKKTVAGKDREEWLQLSRTVQTSVPAARLIDHIRSVLNTH